MNKKELKSNKKSQNKITSKNCSNLISNHQPLISDHKGITLIALVITIIVMLILVGVTVTIALNGGLFNQAKDASRKTQIANIKERVKADIWSYQAENKGGDITAEQLKNVLNRYFDGVPETSEELEEKYNNPDYSLETKEEYGPKVKIKVSDMYNGTLAKDPVYADSETSYIGSYADVDGDGYVDGIIYADLAFDYSGEWGGYGWGRYGYQKETENLKSYIVKGKTSAFRNIEREVISEAPETSGKDRFYVMALEDVDENAHTWYKSAYGKLSDIIDGESNDFGKGRETTKKMIENWNKNGEEGSYGVQDENDMWGIIQRDEIIEKYPLYKWFVPSKSEWAAFGDLIFKDPDQGGFNVPTSNDSKNELKVAYWASTVNSNAFSYYIRFDGRTLFNFGVINSCYIRLSATF